MRFDPARLIGTWAAQAWAIEYPDGRVTQPFGPAPEGRLVYAADGGLAALIVARERVPLPPGNPRETESTARAALFDTCLAYAGTWRVEGDRVRHEIAIALNPVLVGSVQWREPRLDGDRLELVARESVAGGERVHRIAWRRAIAVSADPDAR